MQQTKVVLQSRRFYISHLNPYSEVDIFSIKNFSVDRPEGYGLEMYLKEYACEDEKNHEMRTYLVRDIDTDELVGYFSLKAGLISLDEKEEETGDVNPKTGDKVIVTKFNTLPGVELANFAVNSAYIAKHPKQKGNGHVIFTEFIMPMIDKVAEYAGVKMIYIFALPYDDLIDRYKRYGFLRLSPAAEEKLHTRLKPRYDMSCKFMYQLI
ncbi:MAG: hypothetical protein IKW90_07495 [Lachnospiraceae bacterium]|nr:hypothetical protein [Lachnospiraceae bacterium]